MQDRETEEGHDRETKGEIEKAADSKTAKYSDRKWRVEDLKRKAICDIHLSGDLIEKQMNVYGKKGNIENVGKIRLRCTMGQNQVISRHRHFSISE